MRGALKVANFRDKFKRIIPADAGSTPRCQSLKGSRKDHPRGCGEHTFRSLASVACRGSSPRMRGALTMIESSDTELRIIPADAGSTQPDK